MENVSVSIKTRFYIGCVFASNRYCLLDIVKSVLEIIIVKLPYILCYI